MKKILKFLSLSYQKKKLLSQSLFLVCLIRVSLWLFPFRWISKWLSYFDWTDVENIQADWVLVKNVVKSIRLCGRYVPDATCLTLALATRTLLRLKGQNPQLKIGVDKSEDNKLLAHAWLELDGRIIIGKVVHHQRYTVLKSSSVVS